jgi:MFS family permease
VAGWFAGRPERWRGDARRWRRSSVCSQRRCWAFWPSARSLPVLPRYVTGPLGAGDIAVGVVTGAFAISAVVYRPIGGRLADARGRRVVAVSGMGIASLAGLLYLVPAGVPGLVAARLVLGIGDGWLFTAGAAWIVDLAPSARRGQAIGVFGLAIWGGLTLGPVIGEGLLALAGYDAVFVFAACSPLLGVLVASQVADSHVRHPRQWGRGRRRCFPGRSSRPAWRSRWRTSAMERCPGSSCCTWRRAGWATALRCSRRSRRPWCWRESFSVRCRTVSGRG